MSSGFFVREVSDKKTIQILMFHLFTFYSLEYVNPNNELGFFSRFLNGLKQMISSFIFKWVINLSFKTLIRKSIFFYLLIKEFRLKNIAMLTYKLKREHIKVIIRFVSIRIIFYLFGLNCLSNIEESYHLIFREVIQISSSECVNSSLSSGRSFYNTNFYISNCFFTRFSSYSGPGGVVYLEGPSFVMIISYTVFNNCSCSSDGGAILFYSANSSLKMICAYGCSASYGHFANLAASNMNYVEFLSQSLCSHTFIGSESLRIQSGDQKIEGINLSLNHANSVSCIHFKSSLSLIWSYSTIVKNIANSYKCIEFDSNAGIISSINIIQNNSPSGHGVINNNVEMIQMKYCIIEKNQNPLFCVYSGSIEVSHSFISHSGYTFFTRTMVLTSNNNSIYTSITSATPQTYQLAFYNTYNCFAEHPKNENAPPRSCEQTYSATSDQTVDETLIQTPYRTFNEFLCSNKQANRKQINMVFTFSLFLLNIDNLEFF